MAESAIVVDIPQRLFARTPRPEDLIVYLGERPVEVTEVQRLAGRDNWTVLIYVDAPLTGSETLFRSALALARAAERLTALGPVELLVAASQVETRVSPTRTAQTLETALADLAREALGGELGGDLVAKRFASDSEVAMAALVSRQAEALVSAVRDRCLTDACLLVLLSEGFPEALPPPAKASGVASSQAPERRCCLDESHSLARELAASRWLVGVVAVQKPHEAGSPRERRTEERQLDAAVPDHQKPGHAGFGVRAGQPLSLEKLDLAVQLAASPLKRIVRKTAGFLTATPDELNASLRALDQRVLVWFREPDEMPQDAIRLRVIDVPRTRDLWAPHWWRARPDHWLGTTCLIDSKGRQYGYRVIPSSSNRTEGDHEAICPVTRGGAVAYAARSGCTIH